jgi:hypothetical protein
MEPLKLKSDGIEIIARSNFPALRHISIEYWRDEKLLGTALIALGEQSENLSESSIAALRKAGKDPATRREFRGRTKAILPAEIALKIDALSRNAEAEAEAADALDAQQLAGIAGLSELQSAIDAWEQYGAKLEAMMEDENNDGVFPPKKPEVSITELRIQFPRAAAYIDAQTFAQADHYVKAAAGHKAMQAILSGADHTQAIAKMKNDWAAYCDKHIWN